MQYNEGVCLFWEGERERGRGRGEKRRGIYLSASSWYHPPSLLQCSFFLHRSLSSASPAIPHSAACGSPTAPLTPMRVCECVMCDGVMWLCEGVWKTYILSQGTGHKPAAVSRRAQCEPPSPPQRLLSQQRVSPYLCTPGDRSGHGQFPLVPVYPLTDQVTVNSPLSQFTHSLVKLPKLFCQSVKHLIDALEISWPQFFKILWFYLLGRQKDSSMDERKVKTSHC